MNSLFKKITSSPALFIFIIIIAYFNMIGNNPVFDDHFFIQGEFRSALTVENLLKSEYPIPGTGVYRPIRNIFYAILIPIFSSNPTPYHIFTLSLHLLNTFLIYKLINQISKNKNTAIIGGLLFGLHPIHTESVSWITAGFDLVFVSFYLASIFTYINKSFSKNISLLLGFLAYFSNEIAITLPIILFSYDLLFEKEFSIKKTFEKISPYILGAIIYWILRQNILTTTVETQSIYSDSLNRMLLPIFIFGLYIKQLILPLILSVDHYFFPGITGLYDINHNPELSAPNLSLSNPVVSLSLILSTIFISSALIFFLKKKKISFPFLFTIITLVPVISIIPIPILFTERYAYLASAGFTTLLAILLSKLLSGKKTSLLAIISIFLISGFYSSQVIDRNKDWKNDITLWEATLDQNPESVLALNSLGTVYQRSGDDNKALIYYEKSIQKNPHITKHQINLSNTYLRLNMYQEHIEFLSFLLTRYPDTLELIFSIGNSYEELGDYQNAKNYYLEAQKLLPNHPEIVSALDRVSSK